MRKPAAVKSRFLAVGALVATALLAGCGGAEGTAPTAAVAARRPLYFDVKGLLNEQIQQLTARRAAVLKRVSLRGGAAETAAVPAVKWADELQLFFQADINKAALRGAYAVDSAATADGSGRRRYSRRPGYDTAPVRELLVLSQGAGNTEIRADITQHNALFSARKQLRLRLQAGQLVAYGVTGTQKLVFFDTLRYQTAATVR